MVADFRYAIVIPSHRRTDLLDRTLRSIADSELPLGLDHTIIAENGGKFGAESVVRNAPSELRCEYIYREVGNKSAALNAALDRLSDQFIIFFDDDVRLKKGVISVYLDAAARHQNSFFGGPLECDYEVAVKPWIWLPHSVLGWSLGEDEIAVDQPDFLGANWAAFADHLREVGGFDSRFGPGSTTHARGQEFTMQEKLLGAGKSGVYLPGALVWHFVPADRCSINWSLKRAYQAGVTAGLRAESDPSPKIFGYPRWTLRIALGRLCSAILSQVFASRKVRYERWLAYYWFRGRMDGLREGERAAVSTK